MKNTLFIILLAALPVAAAHADNQRCLDLVKECFAYSAPERDACFKNVSSHSFCTDSQAATLAEKRARLSLVVPNIEEQGPAFLGPRLVNEPCIANFDNAWSAAIVNGPVSNETYSALTLSLAKCAHVPASEVVRP